MSTAAQVPAAPAAGTQEAVNAAESFDSAAASILDVDQAAAAEVPASEAGKPVPTEDGQAPAGTRDGEEKAPAEGKTAEQIAAEAAAVDPWALDQKLLETALAHPELGGLVKTMQGQLAEAAKWREHFPTADEAREFKALAPGGIEELKGLVTSAHEAKAENAEFASGDPARQTKALQSIAADMPEAFVAGAKPYLEALRSVNPEAFQKVGMELATDALKADGFQDMLSPIFAAMAKGEAVTADEEKAAGEALGKLYQWADKAGFAKAGAATAAKSAEQKLSPELQKALDENKAYKEAEKKQVYDAFKSWNETTQANFKTAVNAETAKLIETAVPKNMPTKAREALVSRLSNEIFAGIEAKLNADTDLGEKAAKVIANGAWKNNGEQTRTQVQNLWFGRAKQVLPYVAAEILNPFSEATVAANNARVEKENQTGTRKEVSGGAPANTGGRKLTPKDVKGLSDEAILDL